MLMKAGRSLCLARRRNFAVGSRRWLSSSGGDEVAKKTEDDVRVLYELHQGFKYRGVSGIGSLYTASWMTYCSVEAYYAPSGAIASNVALLASMGAVSVLAGSYVVKQLAAKTVGRLELVRGQDGEKVRITGYSAIGSEITKDVAIRDIVHLKPPNENPFLKTFTLESEYDENRPFYVQIETQENIKDEQLFYRVLFGLKRPPGSDPTPRPRRRKKKKYPSMGSVVQE